MSDLERNQLKKYRIHVYNLFFHPLLYDAQLYIYVFQKKTKNKLYL